jgi:hypothetical protein
MNNISPAFDVPILLLIFNRPDLLRMQIENLRILKPTKIYISSDGPRHGNESDPDLISKCRNLIVTMVDWECNIYKKYEKKNLGCGFGVSSALDWFFQLEEEGIILEDDCQVDFSFFNFCEILLEKYRNNHEIAGICADFKFLRNEKPSNEYGFIDMPLVWGWASWRRVWKKYDFELRDFDSSFMDKGTFAGLKKSGIQYWEKNFKKILERKIDTWDYQLSYYVMRDRMKFIHPMRNLITNKGFSANATHTRSRYDASSNVPSFRISQPYILNDKYTAYNDYLREDYFTLKPLPIRIYRKIISYFMYITK